MKATPGVNQESRPLRVDPDAVQARSESFLVPLRSPHILVMDGELAALERVGWLLSGRDFGITLSSTLLDDATCAFLTPDLVIVDLATVRRAGACRRGERRVLDTLLGDNIPIVLCRDSPERGHGTGHPGVVALAKPFQPAGFLPSVHALLAWRAEQRRCHSRHRPASIQGACELW